MASELHRTLDHIQQGRLREHPQYQSLPDELLRLRHVALSGDGEPTLSPQFAEVVQAVVHVRALGGFPFFKIVLITNATGLDRPQVQESLKRFTKSDEIWVKLDGGTQEYLDKVCRLKDVTLEKSCPTSCIWRASGRWSSKACSRPSTARSRRRKTSSNTRTGSRN